VTYCKPDRLRATNPDILRTSDKKSKGVCCQQIELSGFVANELSALF
jgi:hypothetical protein